MTTIGTFSPARDGQGFVGTITTLSIKTSAVIRPNDKRVANAPDYRIYSGGAEIGAAWAKKSEGDKPYLSVKLDDPSFGTPIYCRLVGEGDAHRLFWNR